MVAKGYAQIYGVDYEETYSPVAKMTTVRGIIAMAATKGWSLHQMDGKNVFLHGDFMGRSVHRITTRLCGPNTS